MVSNYIGPHFMGDAFNCPHCEAYSHQQWYDNINVKSRLIPAGKQHYDGEVNNLYFCFCSKCDHYSIWINEKMEYPKTSIVPLPIDEMPEDVKSDYLEARNIANESARGAAALLRLALQKFMLDLGEDSGNLNTDIANLVNKGLPVEIQKALDSLRVIGNESVHPPGLIDLRDDPQTAHLLFKLLNLIVERMIIEPNEINEIFDSLPDKKKKGIQDRDKTKY
jgi:hypothetical protein